MSRNEGLVWLCLTPCDWCTKLATAPQPNQYTDCNLVILIFLNLFSVMVFILSSHFLLHDVNLCSNWPLWLLSISTPVFPTVILLFSLPSCLARHSQELWRPENNRQAASAVVTNWSDWSNLASCRVDEFQTRQLLSLGHPLGYTSQAVKKKVIST